MAETNGALAALRHPRTTVADGRAAAGGVAASVRDAFRAFRPDDLVQAVREGPVKALREVEPVEIGRTAIQARDAVLEAIAAVATEIARDPSTVPAALARLPRSVTDRLPEDVLERLPASIAERVPAVRRRRRRRLVLRVTVLGVAAAVVATVVAVVLRRRAEERRRVAMGPAADRLHTDGLEPVPMPAMPDVEGIEATTVPDAGEASGLPGMAPIDETRSAE